MRKAGGSLSFIPPQLLTLVDVPPEGSQWIHEVKQDGFRSQIVLQNGRATIYTRRGIDWTAKYAPVAEKAEKLPAKSAIIDGEMVVADDEGRTNIRDFRTAIKSDPGRLAFIAFDLMHLDGRALRNRPLLERRARLRQLVEGASSRIQFSQEFDGSGAEFFAAAERMRLEGIVSKLATSTYQSGRQKTWLKTKVYAEAEFKLVGVQRVRGEAPLAYFTSETGEYVGTAFVAIPTAKREEFWAYTEAGGGKAPAGAGKHPKAVWSRPGLVGTVRFLRGEDHLRHATLKSVRTDKRTAINRQIEQREAVRELLERLKKR